MYVKSFYFLLIFITSFALQAQPDKYYGGANGEKLDWALFYLNNHYVDTVNSNYLSEVAIKSMMKTLDPWSRYQTAKELEDLTNAYKGYGERAYGFNYFWVGDTLMISYINPGGSADLAGLQVNDRILSVNQLAANLTNYVPLQTQLINEDSLMQLSIYRPQEFTKNFNLKKEMLPIISVDAAYMQSPQTAYVKISRFTEKTVAEFEAGVEPLLEQGLQNMIVDLRGNYGGSVEGTIALSDEFLPAGKIINYSQGFNLERKDYLSTRKYSMKNIALIILIDELSMSAAEMFAGAMQDYDRAIIMGKESYGKGLIQQSYTFNDSSAIRFTVGRYYTPAGRYFDQMVYKNKGFTKLVDSISNEYTIKISVPDSLITNTLSGRKIVSSPKGIVPDIYVDAQPFTTKELMLLRGQNLLHTFVNHYMFGQRNTLVRTYETVKKFEADTIFEATLKEQFMAFIQKEVKEKQFDHRLIPATITSDIITEVKALIASQLWGNTGYYYVLNTTDTMLKRSFCSTMFHKKDFHCNRV